MDVKNRIAQFENMAQADPSNEMAHFSLGKAYADAGRHADAAGSYMRCVDLVPDMSKAYQMAADAFLKAGQPQQATQVLLRGYAVAGEKGDLMPKKAMAEMMRSLGLPVPEVESAKTAAPAAPAAAHTGPVPDGMIIDRVTGRLGTKMQRPPFKGGVGLWISQHVSVETFDAWIRQGTKVINELRLDLSRDKDSEAYDQHMREYLGIDDAVLEEIRRAQNP